MALFRVSANDKRDMFYKDSYPLARLTMLSYLIHIYEEAIKAPIYADEFTNWEQPSMALAVAVLAYILPDTTTNYSMLEAQTALKVKSVAKVWAYGTMDENKSFRDYILKTLQLRYQLEGQEWTVKTNEGIRAKTILEHYNVFSEKPIKFMKYSMLVLRWNREMKNRMMKNG